MIHMTEETAAHDERIMQAKNAEIHGLIRQIYDMAQMYDGQLATMRSEIEQLRRQTQDAFVDGVFWAMEGYPTDDTIEDWRAEAKRRWPRPSGLTPVPADAAALPVASDAPITEPTAVTGGTTEHRR